ncbi:MAG: DUF3108 domain-containing protein [Rikenellaceae bacterium]
MKKILLIINLLFSFTLSFSAKGQESAFSSGEHLVYGVDYKIGFNVEVATLSMHIIPERFYGTDHFKITASAQVRSSFKWFYDLNHKYEVWIDSLSMRPSYFQSDLKEENYRFKSSYRYEWDSLKVTTWARNYNRGSSETKIMELTDNSYDAISLFYQLRGIDVDTLDYNTPYALDVVFDDNIRRVYYRYMGKKKISVRKIGDFNTIKIVCTLATSDGKPYDDGNEFEVYLSDDQNKIPVFMYTPIKVGSVNVWLKYYDGLKYPLTSLVKAK